MTEKIQKYQVIKFDSFDYFYLEKKNSTDRQTDRPTDRPTDNRQLWWTPYPYMLVFLGQAELVRLFKFC